MRMVPGTRARESMQTRPLAHKALGSWHAHCLTLRVLSALSSPPLGGYLPWGRGLGSPLELNNGKGLGSGDKSHAAFKANAGGGPQPVPSQGRRGEMSVSNTAANYTRRTRFSESGGQC